MRKTLVQVQVLDDLDLAEKNIATPVSNDTGETVTVGLDGKWYELDLTADHATELRSFLSRYTAAGNEPASSPKVPRGKTSKSKTTMPGATLTEAREFGRRLRAWADERGRTDEYMTPGGNYNVKAQLLKDYQAYLAETDRVHGTGGAG